MNARKAIDWPYVLGLLLLPFVILGVLLLVGWIQGLIRYESAYFLEPYLSSYAVPSTLLQDLETAIRNGDSTLLAEVQGTRSTPKNLEPLPNVRFLIYWEDDGKYTDYLFMDTTNYHRYIQHLKVVDERYVSVQEGLYYFVDSGRWIQTFVPLAAVWWILVILFTIGMWIYRSMAAVRQEMYDDRVPR